MRAATASHLHPRENHDAALAAIAALARCRVVVQAGTAAATRGTVAAGPTLRRDLMQAWADYLDKLRKGERVVDLAAIRRGA